MVNMQLTSGQRTGVAVNLSTKPRVILQRAVIAVYLDVRVRVRWLRSAKHAVSPRGGRQLRVHAAMTDIALTTPPRPPRTRLRDMPPLVKDEDLTPKHRLLAQYMVHGLNSELIARRCLRDYPIVHPDTGLQIGAERKPIPLGEPLTMKEAALVLRMRVRTASVLIGQPAFARFMSKEALAIRDGSRARAMRRIVEQLDRPQIKAADAKVVQEAAALVLGDSVGAPRQQTSVNVNVGVQVTPGYVLDLRDDAKTIDATVTHADGETT